MTGKSSPSEQRRQRLAQALRENLKRRKAQARARSQSEAVSSDGAGEVSDHLAGTGLSPQSDGD